MNELLGLQVAVVESVLDLLEVEQEVLCADVVGAKQPLLRVGPKAFDPVDRGRSGHVLALHVA